MLIFALAIAAAQSSAREPPPDYDHVGSEPANNGQRAVILCDPQHFRFSIRASADAASLDRTYPQRTVVDAEELFEMLPTMTGQLEIRGSLIRYVRCGPYAIKFEGDAYNANIQGESGAYPSFAAVSVTSGDRWKYPKEGESTRLVECDRMLPRARPCPTGYAVRLDGEYDPERKKLDLVETVSSIAGNDPATRKIDVRRWSIDDDLSLWHTPAD